VDDREVVIETRPADEVVRDEVTTERVAGGPVLPPPDAAIPAPGVAPVDAVADERRVSETERVEVLPDGSVERRVDRVEGGVARRARPFDPVWPAMLVLLLLVAAGGVAAWWLTRDESRTVPGVTGLTIDAAVARLQDEDLRTEIRRVPHDGPRDQVFEQRPAAGSDVDKGSTVAVLAPAAAQAASRMPNAVGLAEVDARDRMAEAGVEVDVVRVASGEPAGTVTKQDPSAGADIGSGATVTLTVSKGASKETAKAVTAVTGSTVDDAVNRLQADGFETVIERAPHVEPADVVYAQQPKAGALLAAGKAVTLMVSTGPARAEVPNAIGLGEQEARDRIAEQGLKVTVTQAFSSDQPEGTVIDQLPAAGEAIEKDAVVTLTVSKGAESVTVPNVVGQDVNAAQTAVTDAGLTPNVTRVPSAEPGGTVVAQHPVGGTAEKGSFVRLNVSTGTPR
jgi:beta-lactam-binding protein with PASTA domain